MESMGHGLMETVPGFAPGSSLRTGVPNTERVGLDL